MINNIVAKVFHFNIYAYYLSTNRGRFGCVYCADSVRIASCTLQFAALMLWLTTLTGSTCFFYFEIDNLPKHTFFSSIATKIVIRYFIPVSA